MSSLPWAIIGWIILAVIVICLAAFSLGVVEGFAKQFYADWRRKRAHAGKVTCQGEDVEKIYGDERNRIRDDKVTHKCKKIATRVTPNGYFCDDHWEENSRRYGYYAGISYGHKLNHVVKRTPSGR